MNYEPIRLLDSGSVMYPKQFEKITNDKEYIEYLVHIIHDYQIYSQQLNDFAIKQSAMYERKLNDARTNK